MGVHAYIQWAHYVCAAWDEVRARVHARGHTQKVSERRVCVRAVHGSLSLTLTRPPPQQQPHTQQQEEAKEGRWCGRPRCCRHCLLYLRWNLYRRRFYPLWIPLLFPRNVHAVDLVDLLFHLFVADFHAVVLVVALVLFLLLCFLRVVLFVFVADLVVLLDVVVVLLIVFFLHQFLVAFEVVWSRVVFVLVGSGYSVHVPLLLLVEAVDLLQDGARLNYSDPPLLLLLLLLEEEEEEEEEALSVIVLSILVVFDFSCQPQLPSSHYFHIHPQLVGLDGNLISPPVFVGFFYPSLRTKHPSLPVNL
ncbi:hypothetical protein ECC02_011124 [Trypanosoma cruzi]|uniref:Uncharacterized protein n=1 Tax=Trypanosoma cruzi TaxID=5693 RepID=A0A7J6XNN8_TRYCR|nr:hypothetical protein ECC02_011124 [Trypanosoma cruzi]